MSTNKTIAYQSGTGLLYDTGERECTFSTCEPKYDDEGRNEISLAVRSVFSSSTNLNVATADAESDAVFPESAIAVVSPDFKTESVFAMPEII